jgi:hypothetical protein
VGRVWICSGTNPLFKTKIPKCILYVHVNNKWSMTAIKYSSVLKLGLWIICNAFSQKKFRFHPHFAKADSLPPSWNKSVIGGRNLFVDGPLDNSHA